MIDLLALWKSKRNRRWSSWEPTSEDARNDILEREMRNDAMPTWYGKVDRGEVPDWFYDAFVKWAIVNVPGFEEHLEEWIGAGCSKYETIALALKNRLDPRDNRGNHPWIIDHAGTAKRGDIEIFVSQPYHIDSRTLIRCEDFAKELGICFDVQANCHWSPGKCFSLIFSDRDVSRGFLGT